MRSFKRTLQLTLCAVSMACLPGCALTENLSEMMSDQSADLIGDTQDNLVEYNLPVIDDDMVYVEIADTDENPGYLFLDLKLISKTPGDIRYAVSITEINGKELSAPWAGTVSFSDMENIRIDLDKNILKQFDITSIDSLSMTVTGTKGESDPVVSETVSVTLTK